MEQRLRAAVESSLTGILMIDSDGHIVLVNREVERLFGYSREELLGRSVELLVPERFRAIHVEQRAQFLAHPRMRAMGAGRDLFGISKSGVEVPVEIGLAPIVTEEGLFVLASIVDVRSRRRAEERFRIAVESSPNGMVMIDREGRIVLVNREFERMFGYSRDELLGSMIEMLVPERFRARHPLHRLTYFEEPTERAMGAGRDLFGVRKDGSEIPVEIGLNPIETDDGVFVLGSIVDISSRKSAEAEHRRLESQLRHSQKMEAIGTLAGGIAHDFNNVLSAIVGYAEMIGEEVPAGSRAASDLAVLLKAAERGRQLIARILTFSRRQGTVRKPVALGGAIRDAVDLLRATIPTSIQLRVTIDPSTPRVLADSTSLHQIVMNLATNSAHAMPKGGSVDIQVEPFYVRDSMVRLHPELHEGWYGRLSVRDDGQGMDRTILDRAFEPFFTTKSTGMGSGLGLTMVLAIMRDHDGLVEVESEVGRGTHVTCLFPALDTESDDVGVKENSLVPGRGELVLFVDDEPDIARLGERRLASLGYRVVVCEDAVEALRLFQERRDEFALVITDYTMPKMTGTEFATAIRELRKDLPIMLLTGFVDGLDADAIRRAGIVHVLSKPITISALARTVRDVLDAEKLA